MDSVNTADIDILEQYRNNISNIESFSVGDIVTLRNEKYLPKTGLRFKYAVVLNCDVFNDGVTDDYPGKQKYIKIAYCDYRQIDVIRCDVRILCKLASPIVEDDSYIMLKDFIIDKPITEVKAGMLVRPRSGTFIYGFFLTNYLEPSMIIGSYKNKHGIMTVHLIGKEVYNSNVKEIYIDMDMVCQY